MALLSCGFLGLSNIIPRESNISIIKLKNNFSVEMFASYFQCLVNLSLLLL